MAEQEDVKDFYESEANDYDSSRFSNDAGQYIHSRQTEIITNKIDNWETKTVLEIAAGTGRITEALIETGADVNVIDISRNMITENRSRNSHVNFVQGSADQLPIETESIDVCVIVNAINHIPDYRAVLREIHRVLMSNGTLIANFPNVLSNRFPIATYVNYTNQSVKGGVYTRWFNIFKVKKELPKLGFEVVQCTGDRILPVKALSNVTIPLSRRLNNTVAQTSLSNVSVSPFITARKI